jgi:hypothetical protein
MLDIRKPENFPNELAKSEYFSMDINYEGEE